LKQKYLFGFSDITIKDKSIPEVYSLLKSITFFKDTIGFGDRHQLSYRRAGDTHDPVFPDRMQNNFTAIIAGKNVRVLIKENYIQVLLVSYLQMNVGIKLHGV
jgi:hypothetical protein